MHGDNTKKYHGDRDVSSEDILCPFGPSCEESRVMSRAPGIAI